MAMDLVMGLASLAVAAGLFVIGLPDKNRQSPRFLRFHSSMMIYPAVILVFFMIGVAAVLNWYLVRP